ncbi:hypothetical protein GLOTRDRAFT_136763 [Gloeophyllum trabeum ATCC 11539]|uniref:DASH complex subunit DAD3 n=1 Tax=Gloeophyllum trabeum (strain ATCC 11539 / FP-39264 / Madison 617) TaxID=670483 RepID=S7QET6_GLOTA|nr:uncharacterized protein GLOTRDRAFT_136763 [Gloeophyllum trabeum ATCC 11539]EPQ57942.1 hypothetical protein GLOTRDRAFT_136763 [Gloeophyllum trabeum ATCC 11539]
MSTSTASEIFEANPYENHPNLTQLEADVLWEYAKLNQNIKDLVIRTRQLSEGPDQDVLERLRVLERKMGLVMTLFKVSAWGVINEMTTAEEASESFASAGDITAQP